MGIPKIISAFSNILKPSLERDRGKSIRMIMSSDKKSTIFCAESHPHSDPAFKETSTVLTNCASAPLLFERPKTKKQPQKNQTVSALITTKRPSRLICMLWLTFTYEHTFFSTYGCRHFEKWSTQAFFKRWESRIQRKV